MRRLNIKYDARQNADQSAERNIFKYVPLLEVPNPNFFFLSVARATKFTSKSLFFDILGTTRGVTQYVAR